MESPAPQAPSPEQLESELWDAVVIGTGVGGATAGYALARRGWRVLFIEKGRFLHDNIDRAPAEFPLVADNRPDARLARGWWPYPITGRTTFGERRFFAPLGCGSGGTSAIYAAQLERFRPEDFRPRAFHPGASDSTLPETWPIEYEELSPYYERAEELYRVCGTRDPLRSPSDGDVLREPPPISERDGSLLDSFEECGLHPYRAHVGCEFVSGCTGCGGVVCPRACKSDSGHICLLPAIRVHAATLVDNCEVETLEADEATVKSVRCRLRDRKITIRGRVVLLAAGAFASPVLLLKSSSPQWPDGLANRSGQVGRNLMVHAHVMVAISTRKRLSREGPLKSISLNDFYVDRGTKLGTLQSLGVTVFPGTIAYYLLNRMGNVPEPLRKVLSPCVRLLARVLALPFKNAAIFAGIIEDLPYEDNRVLLAPEAESGFRFEYRYPAELGERTRLFTKRLRDALRPHRRMLVLSGRNNLDYGHVCGTLRFGSDAATSVLDRNNRAHDVTNLYVVDASFLPSSGGTNLSLTIAANALRVGELIDARLRGTGPGSAERAS